MHKLRSANTVARPKPVLTEGILGYGTEGFGVVW